MIEKDGVSVIICTYNGSHRIEKTLLKIMQQVVSAKIHWEVLLIDNASTDGTAETARKAWKSTIPLRIILEPRPGLGNARIRIIHEARYEVIVFLDDDNHLEENWQRTAFELMNSLPDVGAMGGLNLAEFESTQPVWFGRFQGSYAVGPQVVQEGVITAAQKVLWGAGLVFRRQAFQELEGINFYPLLSGRTKKSYKLARILRFVSCCDWRGGSCIILRNCD